MTEFDGQYLTYEEYQSLGGSLDNMPFNLAEFEARKRIDLRTQNRLKDIDEIPQEVKLCVFNMINTIQSYAQSQQAKSISSERVGEYSVTYNSTSIKELVQGKETELNDIIMHDLYGLIVNNEHVIYNGVK
jgi:hypothetical protein